MMSTHQILCAGCGLLISPNESNLCLNCIKASVDITHGIPKQSTVQFCKGCDRYLAPPYQWTTCSLESRELLALLLRKLNLKQRLIDACFLWTEPHSKRLKVKLTIQQPVLNVVLEQVFVVEFVVCNQYCADCTRVDSQLTWKAVVQCRQKVEHKRTFIWLEQLILKHNAHKETCNILEFKDGLDFYFASRNHAIKMVEFLNKMVPIKSKSSQELISADIHAGTADFKFTYSVQLAPVCKDDLVCLPLKVSRKLGTMSQLALCSRVSNMLVFIDPLTGKYSELRAAQYWDQQFSPLAELKELVEFYVMDVEIQHTVGKYAIAIATCCRSQDFSITYQVVFF